MKEDTRVNTHLDMITLCNAIKGSETESLFYVFMDDTYDISYSGDSVNLVNLFYNIIKEDEELREIITTAVDMCDFDDEDEDFCKN